MLSSNQKDQQITYILIYWYGRCLLTMAGLGIKEPVSVPREKGILLVLGLLLMSVLNELLRITDMCVMFANNNVS